MRASLVTLFLVVTIIGLTHGFKQWWDYADGPAKAGKCGPNAPRINGKEAICNPYSRKYYCCSKYGYCGAGSEFCSCNGCKDYRKILGVAYKLDLGDVKGWNWNNLLNPTSLILWKFDLNFNMNMITAHNFKYICKRIQKYIIKLPFINVLKY